MQLYKIKLVDGHNAKRNQTLATIDGKYLGHDRKLCLYTRGEALKKAIAFKGRIEKHGKNYSIAEMKVIQLSRKEISPEILLELEGREMLIDLDESLNETMYVTTVFGDILTENENRPLKDRISFDAADEINTLSELVYLATYVMLVD